MSKANPTFNPTANFDSFALRASLQRAIETPLSRKLVAGEVTDHSRVTVEFKKGELVFEAKAAKK